MTTGTVFHHPIPDLRRMIEAVALRHEQIVDEKEAERWWQLLERLRQELETLEAAVAHLPVGDEP